MKNVLPLMLLAILPACVGPLTLSSPSIEGRVLEESSSTPIAGVIVVARWEGHIGYTGTVCYHVETATSDPQGRFVIRGWQKLSPYGDAPRAPTRRLLIDGYKQGYVHANRQGDNVYLEPFTGSRKERLQYLSRAAVSCSHEREIEINLLLLYRALYEEARSIAVTKEEKLIALHRLRDIERLEQGSDKAWENFRARQKELK